MKTTLFHLRDPYSIRGRITTHEEVVTNFKQAITIINKGPIIIPDGPSTFKSNPKPPNSKYSRSYFSDKGQYIDAMLKTALITSFSAKLTNMAIIRDNGGPQGTVMAEEISSITKVGSQCLCELDHPNKAIRCICGPDKACKVLSATISANKDQNLYLLAIREFIDGLLADIDH
jgi:hypothetical protein